MDIIRAVVMGLGCFGLLVLGSCGMLGFGTVAVMDKAVEIAKEERAAKATDTASDSESEYERYDRSAADYSESTDEDYSDFGDPSVEIKSND